jgi:hypothetical protein
VSALAGVGFGGSKAAVRPLGGEREGRSPLASSTHRAGGTASGQRPETPGGGERGSRPEAWYNPR